MPERLCELTDMTIDNDRRRIIRTGLRIIILSLALGAAQVQASGPKLFDTHLHYTGVDAAALAPNEIIRILDLNAVSRALVSGMPSGVVERLYAAAPDRVIPFLNVYRGAGAKRDWMHDSSLPDWVARRLDESDGIYRGIGELHIFEQDAGSPVLLALADIAAARGLMLQVHGDAEVIDALFARQPELTILWAHLGTDPEPEAIAPVLERHPRLYADTSVRDGRFVDEQGRLRPRWRALFVARADQITVGVDTFWTRRWKRFGAVTDEIRGWLVQLPPEVADKLAYGNAEKLFGR
jgi:hypothetical protein